MRLKFKVEVLEFEDYFIAVPFGDGSDSFRGIMKVNEVGASILNLLSNDTTEKEIIDSLQKEYDVSNEALSSDVRQFLMQFEERGLLQ